MTGLMGKHAAESLSKSRLGMGPKQMALAAALIALIFVAISAWGQSQAINGTIRGRVADPSGAAILDANIAVANAQTGYSRSTNSGSDGYYVFPNLPLGTYTVTSKKDGVSVIEHQNVVLQA